MQELLGVLLLLEFEHVPDLHDSERVAQLAYLVDALEVWQLFIKLPTRFPLKSQSDMPPLLHLVELDNMRYN